MRLFLALALISVLAIGAVAMDDLASLKQKADNGDAAAAMKLGEAYEFGRGVKADRFQAADWYFRAAEAGDAEAQNVIGVKLRVGDGTRKDPAEAVNWYRKAAKQGHAGAMYNLGTAYYNGDGVPINDETSLLWFILAKEFGSKEAPEAVDRSLAEMSPRAAKAAMRHASEMLIQGTETPAKPGAAVAWLNKLVDSGEKSAGVLLALLYLEGNGVSKDTDAAVRNCEQAADAKYPVAMACLGYMYRKGIGKQQNAEEAAKWYEKAANCGDPVSMYILADMYGKGEGVKPDLLQQYALLRLASRAMSGANPALERVQAQVSSAKEQKEAEKRVAKLMKKISESKCAVKD